jgi:sugar lactone lactonase YvrE
VWCPQDRALYWVDIIGQKVNRLGLDDGTVADWDCPEMIGWLLPRAQGGFIAGLKSGFHTLTLEPFTLERIHAPEPDRPGNRMNDACVDARGRIWAGTMQMDGQGAGGHLYRLDHDLSVRRVDEGYHIANGPTISGDGTTLYHTDSLLGASIALPLAPMANWVRAKPSCNSRKNGDRPTACAVTARAASGSRIGALAASAASCPMARASALSSCPPARSPNASSRATSWTACS